MSKDHPSTDNINRPVGMREYYDSIRDIVNNEDFRIMRDGIFAQMDRYSEENKDLPFVMKKAHLYEVIAENVKPVIFADSPFFYEIGVKKAKNLGGGSREYPCMWGVDQSVRSARKLDHIRLLGFAPDIADKDSYLGIAEGPVFDEDHHCVGYTKLFSKGVEGMIEEIDEYLSTSETGSEEYYFRMAAKKGLLALIKIAERFADHAEKLLMGECDETTREYLTLIRDNAKIIPRKPPETFYQGLCMLIFAYEMSESLDGIGMSVLGHIDRLLGPLYERDIESGIITKDEADKLLALWLSIPDIKCGAQTDGWADISCTIELGGSDADGNTVYNEVTRSTVRLHKEMNLLNPKLNCRISKDSPKEYLDLLSRALIDGHNTIAIHNDDTIVAALVSSGRDIRDARLYVNGGCQETVVEGCEHSAGVMFYFSLPRVLELSLCGIDAEKFPTPLRDALPTVIDEGEGFEEFYSAFITNLRRMLTYTTEARRAHGVHFGDTHPAPIFSSTLKGCIESGKDYTRGGAKYNFGTACCVGFATLADSLYAIKRAVYEDKILSLDELKRALQENFSGYSETRARLTKYPKFGHGEVDADAFSSVLFDDLRKIVSSLPNERGGRYQLSTFSFSSYLWAAPYLGATPDGRLAGEPLSQSNSPSRVRGVSSPTDSIVSLKALGLDKCSGVSVLDVMIPRSSSLSEDILTPLFRGFADLGGQVLQPNIVRVEDMIAAKREPEKYKNLIVRVCGLSVYFVNLTPEYQDEMIARNMYLL